MKYLPAWAQILGSRNQRLCYFDCFAGPGKYEFAGEPVEGSPVIAVRAAKEFLAQRGANTLSIFLIENDREQVRLLDRHLGDLRPYPVGLQVDLLPEDSNTFIPDLLHKAGSLGPSFFMVDPYGHPLTVPVINEILIRPKTEVLVTLMWYRINMDLANPSKHQLVNRLFGDEDWKAQPFMDQTGPAREEAFLKYFCSRLRAKYVLPFRIGFDPEDKVFGERTKYYLLHGSNHPSAVLLMKEVMWPLGDEDGTFDYSGESQGVLISRTPQAEELRGILLREFAGLEVTFDSLRARTWKLPFVEKHYRSVIQNLRLEGNLTVIPVSSKTGKGLKGQDRVRFPKPANG